MLAVYKRELRSYFITPIGYIFTGVFLAVSGVLFSYTILQTQSVSGMYVYFVYMLFMFAILLPLLTMKSLSEERKAKTEQVLMTTPVSLASIIFAKYLAALTIFAVTFIVNSFNFFLLYQYGSPNGAVIISNILGLFLIGAAFIAVGIFLSSLTENQLIAAISTMGITALLILTSFLAESIPMEWLRVAVRWFSVLDRYIIFTGGYLSLPSLVYFVSFTVVFLFLTVRVYEKRRWA